MVLIYFSNQRHCFATYDENFIIFQSDEKTKGHIKEPVSPDILTPDTVVGLFNVIFFQVITSRQKHSVQMISNNMKLAIHKFTFISQILYVIREILALYKSFSFLCGESAPTRI